MFYRLYRSAGAEDDGSAWKFTALNNNYERVQVGPLTVHLLRDGLRAFAVASEILVDEGLAREIEAIDPSSAHSNRVANVIGPQPASERRARMIQLLGTELVYLSKASIVSDAEGRRTFHEPYILDPTRSTSGKICKISENGVTIVSREIRDLLALREPSLFFRAVRFSNEGAAPEEREPPAFRMPTAEELGKLKRRN